MKICFLWVDRFKKLDDFSINLSSDYQYHYDETTNSLTREKKAVLPVSFWGESVSEVTGILGTNGAGKTTLLELLCLVIKGKAEICSRYFILYEKKGSLFYQSSDNFPPLKTQLDVYLAHSRLTLDDLGVVYFSNIYDESWLDLGDGVEDVSVNNRVISERRGGFGDKNRGKFIEELEFLTSDRFAALAYPAPEKVSVRINTRFWQKETSTYNDNHKEILRLMRSIFHRSSQLEPIALTRLTIQCTLLMALYSEYAKRTESIVTETFHRILMNDNNETIDVDKLIAELAVVLKCGDTDHYISRDEHFYQIVSCLILLENDLEVMGFKEMKKYRVDKAHFTVGFDKANEENLSRLANLINYISSADIDWAELSSGQRAYINLFSSIWCAIHKIKNKRRSSYDEDILICIDEGDLYLHPQLQLEFIEKLINVLPQLSYGRIQLIITTHSPLLITDLPAQCVTVLTKDKDDNIITVPGKHTFGANIYDIYRHSFEVVTQRTGNVSDSYMNTIIAILDKRMLSGEELDKLKESLTVIGDKLLSYHIKKRIDSVEMDAVSAGKVND